MQLTYSTPSKKDTTENYNENISKTVKNTCNHTFEIACVNLYQQLVINTCSKCGIVISHDNFKLEEKIMFLTIFCCILNIHIFDDWLVKDGKTVRHCIVCNKEQRVKVAVSIVKGEEVIK